MLFRHIETEKYLAIPLSNNDYYININGKIKTKDKWRIEYYFDEKGNSPIPQ